MTASDALTPSELAAILREHIVDTAAAAEIIGLASRTGVHYYIGRGLMPIGRFGSANVYARSDVERIRDRETWRNRSEG